MTYVIAEPCVDQRDRSCIDVCPVDCIQEADRMLIIGHRHILDRQLQDRSHRSRDRGLEPRAGPGRDHDPHANPDM